MFPPPLYLCAHLRSGCQAEEYGILGVDEVCCWLASYPGFLSFFAFMGKGVGKLTFSMAVKTNCEGGPGYESSTLDLLYCYQVTL